jgi:carbon starvation protein
VELPRLTALVGEKSLGAGGAVTLAVGMAAIFGKVPLLKQFMSYWYHFALMFEALFVLTALDTGTRVARFVVQEFLSPVFKVKSALGQWAWVIVTSAVACIAWGYLLWYNEFDTIWKMLGVANQLLAGMALAVGTTIILRTRKPWYAIVTVAPMLLVLAAAATAGLKDTFGVYLRQEGLPYKIDAGLTLAMVLLVGIVLVDCERVWWKVLRERRARAALVEVGVAEPAS